jgi:hypothetical protein
MILPERYWEVRFSLGFDQIDFGVGGILLFKLAEIEAGQLGYSKHPDGSSLCSNKAGAWQQNWIVVGHEMACSDPLIVDAADPALPILTDFHGQGEWQPSCIAISLDAFVSSLKEFARIATGRSTPVQRDANPVTGAERHDFLVRISQLNNGQAEMEFWGALLEA